ncbi:hypothetical protein D3C81_1324520 [compost metagenome]
MFLCLILHLKLDCTNGNFNQISYHGLYVSAHITYFCKFSGLYLNKRSSYKLGQTAGYFCFAYTCRSYHQNIFRHNFILYILFKETAAVAITQCYSHGLLRLFLTYDVFI